MTTFGQRRRRNTASASRTIFASALACIFSFHDRAHAFLTPSSKISRLPAVRQWVAGSSPTYCPDSTSGLSMIAKSGGRMIVTTEQFESEVLRGGDEALPVLVLFSAPWCGPCRLTVPVVKEVMKIYQSKIEVVEVSTDDLPDVASNAGVASIPTIQLYYGGKVKDTIVGCVAKNVLARAVDKVLEDLGLLNDEEV
eukprot:CAMPEP_0171340034 /NCGR_PEP_ID=MMETSP0878-20121228/8313_1 /TAXON_ID=67004 /ORGANISM="Thalassiosira weissflogii, Strain CCMP1336" /LENGTH=195 /DNA_ID=CAMNT_0011842035 /DNA_START=165 /DNA_END=752 /DNA_ORIENTATION=-